MNRPPQPTPRVRSFLPLFLASVILTSGIGVLSLLTLGYFGLIVVIAAFFTATIAVQYVLWGRWLTRYLSRNDRDPPPEDSN